MMQHIFPLLSLSKDKFKFKFVYEKTDFIGLNGHVKVPPSPTNS